MALFHVISNLKTDSPYLYSTLWQQQSTATGCAIIMRAFTPFWALHKTLSASISSIPRQPQMIKLFCAGNREDLVDTVCSMAVMARPSPFIDSPGCHRSLTSSMSAYTSIIFSPATSFCTAIREASSASPSASPRKWSTPEIEERLSVPGKDDAADAVMRWLLQMFLVSHAVGKL